MKRLKLILEENDESREIPPFELNVLALLDPNKRYDFYLYDGKGRPMADYKNASLIEVASYFPGIRETIQFNERHVQEGSEELQGYIVKIKKVA